MSANTHMSLTLMYMYHMHTYTHAFMCTGHFSPGLQGDVSHRGEGSPGASGPQSSRLGTFHLGFPRVCP